MLFNKYSRKFFCSKFVSPPCYFVCHFKARSQGVRISMRCLLPIIIIFASEIMSCIFLISISYTVRLGTCHLTMPFHYTQWRCQSNVLIRIGSSDETATELEDNGAKCEHGWLLDEDCSGGLLRRSLQQRLLEGRLWLWWRRISNKNQK